MAKLGKGLVLKTDVEPDPVRELIKLKQQTYAVKMLDKESKELDRQLKELDQNVEVSNPNPVNVALLQPYMDWINSLPEEQRPLATQLVMASLQPKVIQSSSNNDLMPMFMLMMMQMQQQAQVQKDNTNKDNRGNNEQLQLILKNMDLQMKQMELQSQERVEQMKQMYSIMGKYASGEMNFAELVKALGELKPSTSDELVKILVSGLVDSLVKQDPLEQLSKYQQAGLILDPRAVLELKKEDKKYELEKYKIDKDAEINLKKIDLEETQIEKASEFIAQLGETVHELTSGEEKGKGERTSTPRDILLACPNCNTLAKIPATAEDGYEVECTGCHKTLRVRRKAEKTEKQEKE